MDFNYFITRYRIYKFKEVATPFFACLYEYFEQALKELVIDKNTRNPISINELNNFPKEILLDNFKRNLKHTTYFEEFLYMQDKIGKRYMDYFIMAYFEHMLIREYYKYSTGRSIKVSKNDIFKTPYKCLQGLQTKYYSDLDGKQHY